MKTFKSYGRALRAAGGAPVLRIDDLYFVGIDALTSIDLIAPAGAIAGTVTAGQLNRLGNANHAAPARPMRPDAFPGEGDAK